MCSSVCKTVQKVTIVGAKTKEDLHFFDISTATYVFPYTNGG